MKLSTGDNNPHAHLATIYLNGVQMKNITEADDEQGYVLQMQHENGRYIIDERGSVIIKKLYGFVEIKFREV